jgi:magnesium chelatase subunit I
MDGFVANRPRRKAAVRKSAAPRLVFPFSAIVAQEELRLSLLLCAVDPRIGGVLALGDRGTGKSTAIRALAALLPPMPAIAGCRFNCEPGHPAEIAAPAAPPGRRACWRRCRWWTSPSAPRRTAWSGHSTWSAH